MRLPVARNLFGSDDFIYDLKIDGFRAPMPWRMGRGENGFAKMGTRSGDSRFHQPSLGIFAAPHPLANA